MYPNANLAGIASYGIAVVSIGLMLIPTGYVISWAFDLLGFRRKPAPQQLSVSILAAIAVLPALSYYIMRFLPLATFQIITLANFVVAILLFWRSGAAASVSLSALAKTAILWTVAALLVIALLIDIRFDDSLQLTPTVYDYAKHVSVTDAISRTGVPPANPSYYDGQPTSLYYYYFWLLLCSVADQIGGMIAGPLACVRASVFWCAAALVSLFHTFIFLEIVPLPDGVRRHWGRLVAVSLLITGLDLPMSALNVLLAWHSQRKPLLPVSLDWWNERIQSWFPSLIWVPHHTGAAVISVFCFILLRAACGDVGSREKRGLTLVSGIGFATVLGSSIWVGLVAGSTVAVWAAFSLFRGWRAEVWTSVVVGVIGLVVISPLVCDLLYANHLHMTPISPWVRDFGPLGRIIKRLPESLAAGWPHRIVLSGLRLIFLPLNYFLELGFFALGVIVYARWWRRNRFELKREHLFWIFALIVPLLICTFFKSTIRNNDLGWRGFLLLQIMLAVSSLPLLAALLDTKGVEEFALGYKVRLLAITLLLLGVCGTLYEAVGTRFGVYDGMAFSFGNADDRHRAAEMAGAYGWIAQFTPRRSVVQHNPSVDTEVYHLIYGHRQTALSDANYGSLYGINIEMYDKLAAPLGRLFSADATADDFAKIPLLFGIDFVLATARDAVWTRADSWVWQAQPVYSSPYVRIFRTSATLK